MDNYEGDCGGNLEHEAVSRLYELAREGDTGSGEYSQLDSLVYDSLLRTYGVQPAAGTDQVVRIEAAA